MSDASNAAVASPVDPGARAAGRDKSAMARWAARHRAAGPFVPAYRHAPGLIAGGALVMLCALSVRLVDAPIARWVHASGVQQWVHGQGFVMDVIRWPGHFMFACVVGLALWPWHRWRWQAVAVLMGACLISGSNWFLKWVVGRRRPDERTGLASFDFAPFREGWVGLFHQRNLSMPSGDVSLAFAVAATLGWLLPRWRWAFWAGAAVVACERVAENAHHLSDVLAGAALGIVSFHLGNLACSLVGARTARDLGIEPPANRQ